MREGGGTLDVRLEPVALDEQGASRTGEVEPGEYGRIRVEDTGHGVPPEIIDRIFDPFFTTKKVGEGTGMGLSVAHGIVKSHGGSISVHSQPGQGTFFHVYLPLVEESAADFETRQESAGSRGETILLVDDEPAIVNLLKTVLENSGYRVEALADSVAALEVFRARPAAFDLVITDYTMPKLSGTRFARELTRIDSKVSVILISGYGELIDRREVDESGIRYTLTKPLRSDELTAAVRHALDSRYG